MPTFSEASPAQLGASGLREPRGHVHFVPHAEASSMRNNKLRNTYKSLPFLRNCNLYAHLPNWILGITMFEIPWYVKSRRLEKESLKQEWYSLPLWMECEQHSIKFHGSWSLRERSRKPSPFKSRNCKAFEWWLTAETLNSIVPMPPPLGKE